MKRFQAPISEIRALAIPPQVNKLKFFITLQNYSGLKTKTRAGHHIDFHFPTNWKYSSPFIQSTLYSYTRAEIYKTIEPWPFLAHLPWLLTNKMFLQITSSEMEHPGRLHSI